MIRRGGKQIAGAGLPWPNPAQAMLLRAAIGPQADIASALAEWQGMVDLDAEVDGGTYRLLPLVFVRARDAGLDLPLLGVLKGVYRRHWCETHSLLHATRHARAALHAAGIPMLAVKGLPLAASYYPTLACRPMCDLDLVVAHADLARALDIFQSLGWRHPGTPLSAPASQHPATPVQSPDGMHEIDLHWHCQHEAPYAAADAWFWRDASPLDVDDIPLLQPRATAMLVHTVLHGTRSNQEPPIRWIADAALILQKTDTEIDWDELVTFARHHRVARRLFLGLEFLAKGYAIEIPPSTLHALRRLGTSPIEYFENRHYLGGEHRGRRYPRLLGLTAHLRVHRDQPPWRWLPEIPTYLAQRWGLPDAGQLPAEAIRRLAHRLLPSQRATA